MSTTHPLDLRIAYWAFGWLPSDELPQVALEALEAGFDSPSFVKSAGCASQPDPDHHQLLEAALREIGRSRPGKSEAGRIIARDFAERIVNGAISPLEGAKGIWRVSLACEELRWQLGIFGGRASEYDEVHPDLREDINALIVKAAHDLIDGRK